MDRVSTEIGALVDRLHGRGRLRVWSIIISIFGDSVLPHGGTVSAGTLGAIAEALRIEPGALRSALSRLAKEGWIAREKVGRNSRYSLSPEGLRAFVPAAERIYAARGRDMPARWTVAIPPRGENPEADGFVPLGGGVFISERPVADVPDCLVLDGPVSQIPDWVKLAVGPEQDAEAYREIPAAFGALKNTLDAGAEVSPLQAITARTLLIHDWRRAVLRHADLPEAFFPDDWPAADCRAFVAGLYGLLTPSAEAWLAAAPELSDTATGIDRRFRPS